MFPLLAPSRRCVSAAASGASTPPRPLDLTSAACQFASACPRDAASVRFCAARRSASRRSPGVGARSPAWKLARPSS